MKKKILALILISILLLSACGNQFLPTISDANLDNEVEIIMAALMTDEEQTIESYVEKLNLENSDHEYKVYNKNHYSYTITEKERLDMVESFTSKKGIREVNQDYSDFLAENEISDYVTDFELSEDFTEVKLYVQNLDELDLTPFLITYIGSQAYWVSILDAAQAYLLISPEERVYNVIFIDNETKEEIDPLEN